MWTDVDKRGPHGPSWPEEDPTGRSGARSSRQPQREYGSATVSGASQRLLSAAVLGEEALSTVIT